MPAPLGCGRGNYKSDVMAAAINTSGVDSRVNQTALNQVAVVAANQLGKGKFNKIERRRIRRCVNRRLQKKARRLGAKQWCNGPNGLMMSLGRAERRFDPEIHSETSAQYALRLPLESGHLFKGETTPLLSWLVDNQFR